MGMTGISRTTGSEKRDQCAILIGMSSREQSSDHPYSSLAGSPQWAVIDRAVLELAQNRDLVETTAHEYIVGSLCKALADRWRPENESSDLQPVTRRVRSDVLSKLREAVKAAKPTDRDLVEELIAERTAEGQHE